MYAIKITGTASQCKNSTAITANAKRRYFGRLFFTDRSLNFRAIKGSLLTISQQTTAMSTYRNHLLSNISVIALFSACQYTSGSDAMSNPAAGIGTPLKPYCCVLSRLNLAKRYAPAAAINNDGTSHSIETSRPSSCFAKLSRKNWYTISDGATPKLTISARESSCLPISDVALKSLATKPSRKSTTAAMPINNDASHMRSGISMNCAPSGVYCITMPFCRTAIMARQPKIRLRSVNRLGICFMIERSRTNDDQPPADD